MQLTEFLFENFLTKSKYDYLEYRRECYGRYTTIIDFAGYCDRIDRIRMSMDQIDFIRLFIKQKLVIHDDDDDCLKFKTKLISIRLSYKEWCYYNHESFNTSLSDSMFNAIIIDLLGSPQPHESDVLRGISFK